MSDAPNVSFRDNGHIVYRASTLGGCTRMLTALRAGYDPVAIRPDAKINQTFAAGHAAEILAVKELASIGIAVTESQTTVSVPVTSTIFIEGHCDGLAFYPVNEDYHVVEIKSMSETEYARWMVTRWETTGLIQKYKWQVSSYMVATGYPLLFIVWNRDVVDGAAPVYDISTLTEPWYDLTALRARVLHIEAAARREELPVICDTPSYPCPVFYLTDCNDREITDDPDLSSAISRLGREYVNAASDEKEAKGRKNRIKTELRQVAGSAKKIMAADGTKVTFYDAANPPSFDKDQMTLDGIDWGRYLVKTTSERLRVTLPDSKLNHETESEGTD